MRGSSLCFTAVTIRSKKNLVFGIIPLLKLLYGTICTDSIYKGKKTSHNQTKPSSRKGKLSCTKAMEWGFNHDGKCR